MKAKVLHLKNYIKINEKIPILIRKIVFVCAKMI